MEETVSCLFSFFCLSKKSENQALSLKQGNYSSKTIYHNSQKNLSVEKCQDFKTNVQI